MNCEKCGIQYERSYDINRDVIVNKHPINLCEDSKKQVFELKAAQIQVLGTDYV